MFSANKLSEDQKTALHEWAAQGATIADLQKHLKEDFGIGVTYMDARFLVLDLGIQILEPIEDEVKPVEADAAEAPVPTGVVEVNIDSITLPGALVSGKVSFSDGQTAIWMLDHHGRPALDPDTPGYRPSAEDIADFQKQLSALIRKKGF